MVRIAVAAQLTPQDDDPTSLHGWNDSDCDSEQRSCDATTNEDYTCSACGSTWSYRTVRNTGRCPACGDGLRRTEAPGQ
jgi:hypothetical protein